MASEVFVSIGLEHSFVHSIRAGCFRLAQGVSSLVKCVWVGLCPVGFSVPVPIRP